MDKITIEDIRQISWNGNFHFDSDNFKMIDAFILDESNPKSERLECLTHIDKGMGETCGPPTEEEFQDYLECARSANPIFTGVYTT